MGTPDFATASLDALHSRHEIAAVVTAPDKPAGRGLALNESSVKKFAVNKNIPILQPVNLKDEQFIESLHHLGATMFVVVAFRMLPASVWEIPPLGTINLHASLLPDYRGAAPINHAIINGEKETGVTTFYINHEIDKGSILFNEKTVIGDDETAGELHDRLRVMGSLLLLKTVDAIASDNIVPKPQESFMTNQIELHLAPKIHKEDCRIRWNKPCRSIYNFIRGLSPYPAAFTELISPAGDVHSVKIFRCEIEEGSATFSKSPSVTTDGKNYLKVVVMDGSILVKELQLSGKKRMMTEEFLRGFKIDNNWKVRQD